MPELSRTHSAAGASDPSAADRLLPLVYEELRRIAASKLAKQHPGHSIQATSLVHEAYLRLVEHEPDAKWGGRRHFFSAAAESMRRILVDRARRKAAQKRGGDRKREHRPEDAIEAPRIEPDLLELDAALDKLKEKDPRKAELVMLRYFAGFTMKQAAEALEISHATADRDWAYAKAWLFKEIADEDESHK